MILDAVVIGGGLTGLAIADGLNAKGRSFVLLESRERLGGRILSVEAKDVRYDLGPAWFWVGQRRIEALSRRLGIQIFRQFAKGNLVFEDETGAVRRDLDFSMTEGAFRLDGGMAALIEGLGSTLPPETLKLAHTVLSVDKADGHWEVVSVDGQGTSTRHRACQVVLALPPRLAAETIDFGDWVSPTVLSTLSAIPTWMAGHAKAIAVYTKPFWRDRGLSGDGISHRGPLGQIHDASPMSGQSGALMGFLGIDAKARGRLAQEDREAAILSQLANLFGDEASAPLALLTQDWTGEPATATAADHVALQGHPAYGMPAVLESLSQKGLIFSGTELARRHGGLLEGALESAEDALLKLAGFQNR